MTDAPVHLRKLLGRGDVLAIAFGAMVGWSWVVLAGEMILRAGAVGSILAFGAGAVMVWLVGLTYAELSSALSRAGGEISFTFVALGPGGAFVCGWTLVLAYVAVCAFEAVALPTVVSYLLPGFEAGSLYTVAGWEVHASWVLVGVAGAVVIGVVNYRGIRFAAFAQRLAVGSLLLVGLAFFLPGTVRGDAANLTPWITGWEGVLRVVIMTPFLYVGFDVIPQLAEEIDVPFRTIGRIIVLSILMALGWYGLVQWTVGLSLDPATLSGRAAPYRRRHERRLRQSLGRGACSWSAARSASSRAGTRSSSALRDYCSRWPAAGCCPPCSRACTRATGRRWRWSSC